MGDRVSPSGTTPPPLPGGQLALVDDELVPVVDAQRGLDGAWYAVDRPPEAPSAKELHRDLERVERALRHASATERRQLAFDFGAGEVRQPSLEWRQGTARAMEALDPVLGRRLAQRYRVCGQPGVKRCKDCGADDRVRVHETSCESRVCPSCQRQKMKPKRKWLAKAMRVFPLSNRGKTWWFDTLSVRRPEGTSIARLRDDFERGWQAWRAIWSDFHKAHGADRAFVSAEVSPGGVVHFHVLIYQPFVDLKKHRPELDAILAAHLPGTTRYHRQRVVHARKGHRRRPKNEKGVEGAAFEVAKYTAKCSVSDSPNARQTHPILAAMIALAFFQAPRFRRYGNWDPMPELDLDDEGELWTCDSCGSHRWAFCPNRVLYNKERGPP